jgi:hypothetical protein
LLDANRTIGQPNKITVIVGRKVTKQYRGSEPGDFLSRAVPLAEGCTSP